MALNWLEQYNEVMQVHEHLSDGEIHACVVVLKQKLRLNKNDHTQFCLSRALDRIIKDSLLPPYDQRSFLKFSDMTPYELVSILWSEGKMKFLPKDFTKPYSWILTLPSRKTS